MILILIVDDVPSLKTSSGHYHEYTFVSKKCDRKTKIMSEEEAQTDLDQQWLRWQYADVSLLVEIALNLFFQYRDIWHPSVTAHVLPACILQFALHTYKQTKTMTDRCV